ncbi:hypothetical protein [Hymenobacter arcticus]
MKVLFLTLLPAGLLIGNPFSALAQKSPSIGSNVQQAANMADANIAKSHLPIGNVAPPKTAAATLVRSYAYVPTEALRQETVRRAVANAQDTQSLGGRDIAEYVGPNHRSYQPYYDTARRATGLPDNDAAAAMAVYMLTGYSIINNYRTDMIMPAMAQGVRNQLLPLLASSPRYTTPVLIAQAGEDMKLQTVLLVASWQQSIKAGTSEGFRRNTATYFTSHFNMDFTQKRPSSQGFVNK